MNRSTEPVHAHRLRGGEVVVYERRLHIDYAAGRVCYNW